ncbi:MAG TPA: hypothetical protein VES95_00230 [Dermatophilaceae bacterium]|nr:hypothetical protein [Dermatophilaceae bacterium]
MSAPDGSGLDWRGGVGGVSVALDELGRAASVLSAAAGDVLDDVAGLAATTTAAVLDGVWCDLSSVAPEVLLGARRVDAAVGRVVGPAGATGAAADLIALAAATVAAAEGYAAADRAVAAAGDAAADGVMALAALGLPLVLAGTVTAAGVRLVSGGVVVTPAEVAALDRAVHEHPWLVDLVAAGAQGFVAGLAALGPGAGWALAVACAADGRPFPPRTDAQAVGVLAAVGALGGRLDESPDGVAAVPVVRQVTTVVVGVDGGEGRDGRDGGDGGDGGGAIPAPRGVGDLLAGDVALGQAPGRVRVVEVPQHDGSSAWVVQLPGTQEWAPTAGSNPVDLTTDVRAMAGDATVLAAGAARALALAQAATGRDTRREPVLLTGHSQGGIVAAALASDADFGRRHRVTGLLVAGAPVAGFPVPATVSVLALEHRRDPVPRLDGLANPDRAGWTTVTRDLPRAADGGSAGASHAGERYVETGRAVDRLPAGEVPSLDAWRRSAAPFLALGAGPGAAPGAASGASSGAVPGASPGAFPGVGEPPPVVVREFTVERGWQNARP